MNFRRINSSDLADMAVNILDLLGGTELSAIDVNVRASLIAALGTLPAELQSRTYAVEVREAEKIAEVTMRNAVHAEVETWIMQVRNFLESGRANKKQYDLCGLYFPPQPVSMYVAADPTDLSVTGYSTGENKLRFRGNNKYGHVMYEISRRPRGGEWSIIGSIKKQSFVDTPVTPGVFYGYKVRAMATKNASNFSNTAVVYPKAAI